MLINVSSLAQGNIIDGTSAHAYQYCMVAVANECVTGSTSGTIYVNAPHVDYAGCFNSSLAGSMTNQRDICIAGEASISDAFTQTIGDTTETGLAGQNTRTLIKVGSRTNSPFMSPTMTNDNRYMLAEYNLPPGGLAKQWFSIKLPRRIVDGISRNGFLNQAIAVVQHANVTAFLRFGTAENNTHSQSGSDALLNCTGRLERCVSVNTTNTVTTLNPYWMESTESSSWSPVDVATSGTTIYMPAYPEHAMYYQVVYKDKTSGVLSPQPLKVILVR